MDTENFFNLAQFTKSDQMTKCLNYFLNPVLVRLKTFQFLLIKMLLIL